MWSVPFLVFETRVEVGARLAGSGAYLRLLWDTVPGQEKAPAPKLWVNGTEKPVKVLKTGRQPVGFGVTLAGGALKEGKNIIRVVVPTNVKSIFQGAWLDLAPVMER